MEFQKVKRVRTQSLSGLYSQLHFAFSEFFEERMVRLPTWPNLWMKKDKDLVQKTRKTKAGEDSEREGTCVHSNRFVPMPQ